MKYISPFAILSRHNLAVFFVAGNAIFDDVSHAVFLQQSSILFLLDLSQCLLAGSVHISIFGIFQFNNDIIRFMTSARLERYTKIVEWDHGYLVVMAKYKNIGEVEEYIDLIPILDKLYYDVDKFLEPIK